MTQPGSPSRPDRPQHHPDAPPPQDPRSLARGLTAGIAVLLVAGALAIAGPWPGQAAIAIALLGWIAAVVVGGWAYRGASPNVVVATRWLLILGVLSVVATAALVLLSFAVRDVLAGSVIFGTSGSDCDIDRQIDVFGAGEPVYAVAHTSRVVQAGEMVTVTVSLEGSTDSRTREAAPRGFDCLGSALHPAGPGMWRVEVRVADEVLADGAFEVTATTPARSEPDDREPVYSSSTMHTLHARG